MKMFFLAALILLLSACAGVPKNQKEGIKTDQKLVKVKEERNASIQKFVDVDALQSSKTLSLPEVLIAEGVVNEKITQSQAELVANRAGREICKDVVEYFEIRQDDSAELKLRVVVTAINPTSAGASGASALVGTVVPGPFRLPIGLGGLAADASADDMSGKQVLVTKWAKGANSITNDAKVSRIGDAYQLAAAFASAFSKWLINPDEDKKILREKLSQTQIDNNKRLCETRFGKASVAGRGASLLLPLAPEAYDSGAPKASTQESSPDASGVTAPEVITTSPAEIQQSKPNEPVEVIKETSEDSVIEPVDTDKD